MPGNDAAAEDAVWASRCSLWHDQCSSVSRQRPKSFRRTRPLVLAGFGVSIRVEGGTLRIRNGFTHHPQKQETYRFFKGDLDLPERIILLDCTGSLSFDVMAWLMEQDVTLIKLNWRGELICLAASNGFSANSFRCRWQWDTRDDAARRMVFCNKLISHKIQNSIATLEKITPRNEAWESAMRTAYAALSRIEERPATGVEELRGIEGTVAAAYFRAWADRPINWRKRSRHPIPPSWRKIGIRGSGHFTVGNKNAHHPVNAVLNYAYGILESRVRIGLIAEGYDPTIGIMHESRRDSVAFAFDLMEVHRAETDLKVFRFVNDNEFDPADFVIRQDGVCRLNPEMTRALVTTVDVGASIGRSVVPRWISELG